MGNAVDDGGKPRDHFIPQLWVADKIKSGLGVAGPVIDNYANLLLNDPHLALPISPVGGFADLCRVLKNSQHASEARRFIRYLLSPEGQRSSPTLIPGSTR
jgi:ABC-type Fe3+ transport system substrate-binding protein